MEKKYAKQDLFSQTFNKYLVTELVSFFDFQTAFPTLALLNQKWNYYFSDKGQDYVWKQLFTTEFLMLEYPDHKKLENETYREYFQRSFQRYKHFRQLISGIIDLTNAKRSKKQYGFLRDFRDRYAPEFFIQEIESITFQIECIYKNFNDQDPNQMIHDPDEEKEFFSNFKLWTIKIAQHNLQQVLLTPSAILNFRNIIESKCGILGFPFTHTNRYRQVTFIDNMNQFGRGCNAIYSVQGVDRTQAMYVFDSPETYLTLHYNVLKGDKLWCNEGEISVFRKDPKDFFGSVTVTNGIQVQAQAWLIHQFCKLDKDLFPDAPTYAFVYQHRITIDQITGRDRFKPCKLIVIIVNCNIIFQSRHWRFYNSQESVLSVGPGVQGKQPVFKTPDDFYIYQTCIERSDLTSFMEGYYLFRFLREGEEATDEEEDLRTLDQSLLFQVFVQPIQFRLFTGFEFVQNPNFQPHMIDQQ
ncbi:UNKNOWN [Stylonychia lemnae]|uniref:ApaG domain-containing protein n=1 Tax=Stylonychia lemnae TaxID=5949 RepID=A0A078A363_STYLE|nr:UNKNOWN [Stylonychia lemnae]|eukprot:CDW76718.1 UNKNOWN [Stylonychia lemnae]